MVKPRFARLPRSRNVRDEKGTVLVKVVLAARSSPVRGNIVRSFSVSNTRVSEVAACIEESLFAGGPQKRRKGDV